MSVVSDLNIICLYQSTPSLMEDQGTEIEVIDKRSALYGSEWQILKFKPGVWYTIYPGVNGERLYEKEYFEKGCFNLKKGVKYYFTLDKFGWKSFNIF